jgi:tRNA modification GTPase
METLITVLTPPGKAAIATLAVRGPKVWEWTRTLFRPKQAELPAEPIAKKLWFGKIGLEAADDVILAVKEISPSVSIEVHCHGGIEVVCMIQELFVARGAVAVRWQQFVPDSALLDLLAQAPTARTAAILLDQVNGAWNNVSDANVGRLAELIPLGQHLVEPWKVVIAGAPNVGKSSLMNALAGYTRSVVAPTPGTTRDVVGTRIAIDGWPIELIDTAGMRATKSELERQGTDADLRLWLLDGSATPIYPEIGDGWRFIINKIDLPPAWEWKEALRISAVTGARLPELCEVISTTLVPRPPETGEPVPCLPEQTAWVRDSGR